MIGDVPGGPGWTIRGSDLRPEIADLVAFRDALAADPLADAVELLWTGRPGESLDLLRAHRPTRRVRALIADCLRDLGDVGAAIVDYERLVAETLGTAGEAAMRQHRGKALLAAGRTADALADFEIAACLRRNGDPELLASSEQACAFAWSRMARG